VGFLKKFIFLFILYVSLLAGGYFVYTNYFVNNNVNEVKGNELIKEIEQVNDKQANDLEGEGFEYHPKEEMIDDFQKEENVLALLLQSIKQNKKTLFAECFEAKQYMDDLFKVSDDPYSDNVTEQFMNGISRGGKLESISIIDENNSSAKVGLSGRKRIALNYSDGKRVKVNVEMKLIGTNHDTNDRIYFITSSVLDMIAEIEKQIT